MVSPLSVMTSYSSYLRNQSDTAEMLRHNVHERIVGNTVGTKVSFHVQKWRIKTTPTLVHITAVLNYYESNQQDSGFGGLEVACWPLVPKFAGSHPAEAVGFLGRKNPQHAFPRRGSKAVGPMS